MSETLGLACELMRRASITPRDEGCQTLISERLERRGFSTRWMPFGEVSNVLLTHGDSSPSLWLLGHTDVVPSGPETLWTSPPFDPQVRDGVLYGRGACDMKGAVAAMVIAMEGFIDDNPDHVGEVGLLLTSDEEGEAQDGIRRVAGTLRAGESVPDFCLVGEPSSAALLGDTVRIGRRGSIYGTLTVHGTQGHTAFPQTIENPVHALAPFLADLTGQELDSGVDDEKGEFPPSHCQVSNLNAGSGAMNVTPASAQVGISFRYNTLWNADSLRSMLEARLARHGIEHFELEWHVSGEPFLSPPGPLRNAVAGAVRQHLSVEPELNTGGGTSDGRFLAPLGTEVVELGLINASIHKVDEHVIVEDLDRLAQVYREVIQTLLGP